MKAVIKLDDLKRLIKSTSKFISKDENRQMLQYIRLDFNKDNSTVQATALDGFKISTENAHCNVDESFNVYIKPYLPVGAKSEYATIEIVGENCLVKVAGGIVGYRQPAGEFVDIQAVLENLQSGEVQYRIAFNKDYLLDLLKSIEFEDKTVARNPIILEFRNPIQPVIFKTKTGLKAILPCRDNR